MSQSKTRNAAEDLMASLMEELNLSAENANDHSDDFLDHESQIQSELESSLQGLVIDSDDVPEVGVLTSTSHRSDEEQPELNMASILNTSNDESNLVVEDKNDFKLSFDDHQILDLKVDLKIENEPSAEVPEKNESIVPPKPVSSSEATVALTIANQTVGQYSNSGDSEKTVAIAGYTNRNEQNQDHNAKVSVGQSRAAFSSGYAAWGNSDSQLAQAENLRIAQEKILEIEKENEKFRMQNEELIAASEIVRERADLLTAQVQEFKNDRDNLEQSYKNEMQLIRNQFHRKDNELQKAQMKIDELDSRLKFDMKKIRIRERELENRLELIRAEKNALVKSKDEQILDLRRKMDQVQMEVESYRQKCVDLNRVLDTNQDSFKRTTRALRLAMANLELQDENKIPLKKAD
jgi:hypothetical protein